MFRWMRSVRIAAGKAAPALAWATEIAEYVKKYEGPEVKVFMDAFGEVGTIRWMVDYDSLATFEKVMTQLMADQEYFQKLEKTKELLIEGSGYDVVMRSL
jgi:hypothetical protein